MRTLKVYIAGYFDTRARLRPYRDALRAMGYEVSSTWLDEENVTYASVDSDYHTTCAVRDVKEVKESDCFILDTIDETPRGGREVEYGVALTRAIPRYVVGPARNVFHYLATRRFDTWEELLDYCRPGA